MDEICNYSITYTTIFSSEYIPEVLFFGESKVITRDILGNLRARIVDPLFFIITVFFLELPFCFPVLPFSFPGKHFSLFTVGVFFQECFFSPVDCTLSHSLNHAPSVWRFQNTE